MKKTVIPNLYTAEEDKLSLIKSWEYSKRLGEKDKLLVRTSERSFIVTKKDLCKKIEDSWLAERWNIYQELKARLYNFINWGMPFQVEDTLKEMKEFKQKYLLPKNELSKGPYYKK